MTTGALVNARVNYGYGKVAQNLGFAYSWYRPQTGVGALDASGLLGTVTAYITTDASLKSAVPPSDASPNWYGAYDSTLTQPGDYFVGALGTFFIAAEFLPAPPALVFCNETFTLSRRGETVPGPAFRGGGGQNPTTYATAFPGWIKAGGRRQPSFLHLPGEVQNPTSAVLLPQSIPQQILRGDILTSAETTPQVWQVQSADLSFNCWNLVVTKVDV